MSIGRRGSLPGPLSSDLDRASQSSQVKRPDNHSSDSPNAKIRRSTSLANINRMEIDHQEDATATGPANISEQRPLEGFQPGPQNRGSITEDSPLFDYYYSGKISGPRSEESRAPVRLTPCEVLAMRVAVGATSAEFLKRLTGADCAVLTKIIAGAAQEFCEYEESFENGSSGAWRDQEANETAMRKLDDLELRVSECITLLADPSSLAPYIRSPRIRETIMVDMQQFLASINILKKRVYACNAEVSQFNSQNPGQYKIRHSYLQLTTEQEISLVSKYLNESAFNAFKTIDKILVQAEQAQMERDIRTEKAHATAAHAGLKKAIQSLENSPRYQMDSLLRSGMQVSEPFKIQSLIAYLQFRASLLEDKILVIEKHISDLQNASASLLPDSMDTQKATGSLDRQLKYRECMNILGFSLGNELELDDNIAQSWDDEMRSVHEVSFRYGDLLTANRRVFRNTSGLAPYDGSHSVKACITKLTDELHQYIPTETLRTEGLELIDELSKYTNGFNEFGLPNSLEALCSLSYRSSEDSLYLLLEKLSFVKMFCKARDLNDTVLNKGFRILDCPEVQSAMQKVRFACVRGIWPGIESRAASSVVQNSPLMSAAERRTVCSLLSELEDHIRTNHTMPQHRDSERLAKILAAVGDKLVGDKLSGREDNLPLMSDIRHMWANLTCIQMSAKYVEYENRDGVSSRTVNHFVECWGVFNEVLRDDLKKKDEYKEEVKSKRLAMEKELDSLVENDMEPSVGLVYEMFSENRNWTGEEVSESLKHIRDLLVRCDRLVSSDKNALISEKSRTYLSKLTSMLDQIEYKSWINVLKHEFSGAA